METPDLTYSVSPSSSPSPGTPASDIQSFKDWQSEKKLQRLRFLVEKSKIYASILSERLASTPSSTTPKPEEKTGETAETSEAADKSGSNNEESQPRRSTRKGKSRKAKPSKGQQSILSFVSKEDVEKVTADKSNDLSTKDQIAQLAKEGPKEEAVVDSRPSIRQPSLVTGGQLHPYQLAGVEWLISLYENGLNGVLADEMGLGKTLQTISFLGHLIEHKVSGPFLIVAPLSTIENWCNEFHRFSPTIKVLKYHGTKEERAQIRAKQFKRASQMPVVVSSYDIIMRDATYLQKQQWKYIIVDEGHRLKNMNSRLIRVLKSFDSANRLLLTGTPLQNNLAELWSLLNFLLPDIFSDLDLFQQWFEGVGSDEFGESENVNLINSLHSILRPFLLRRVKSDVEKFLPEKREYIIYGTLTQDQADLYERIVNKTVKEYIIDKLLELRGGHKRVGSQQDAQEGGRKRRKAAKPKNGYDEYDDEKYFAELENIEAANFLSEQDLIDQQNDEILEQATREAKSKNLQNIVMQLRLACDSPHLFFYPWTGNEKVDNRIITASGKMVILDKMVKRLFKDGHKVLIFSQFTKMLNLLHDWADMKRYSVCRIDGTTGQQDRQQQIEQFNSDKKVKLFLLSTRAGGLGINLTAADTVILFDSDWNPQQDLQAIDRVHRIGQTKPVMVYRLATENTVEETLLDKASSKRRLEKLVIENGRFIGPSSKPELDARELQVQVSTIKRKGESEAGYISDRDFETILDRSPEAYERARDGKEHFDTNIICV